MGQMRGEQEMKVEASGLDARVGSVVRRGPERSALGNRRDRQIRWRS